jgi:hypothetical protein
MTKPDLSLHPQPLLLTGAQRTNQALACLFAALLLAILAVVWASRPDWFLTQLQVPYPIQQILDDHVHIIKDFPVLLFVLAAVLALMAFSFWLSARYALRTPDGPYAVVSPLVTHVFLTGLLLIGAWLSYRNWLHWQEPLWDDYCYFGELLHYSLRGEAESVATLPGFMAQYPHSPSPLTPVLISLLMFLCPSSALCLQGLSLAATAGSVLALKSLAARLVPSTPFWPLGMLFLTNAATMRNSLFPQLDAINCFFILCFFWLWMWWREQRTTGRTLALLGLLALAVFQKTTLFPLLAVPTLVEVVETIQSRVVGWKRLGVTIAVTAVFPAILFGAYLLTLNMTRNFGWQVELMGTGWNILDFSPQRFLFATSFLIGPYLPLVFRNRFIKEPFYMGVALFVILFFASLFAVRGPFWSRYYSHVVGPCLLLALPRLSQMLVTGMWRVPLPAYLFGVAAVQYAMLWRHIF